MTQKLHLVFGGELVDPSQKKFRDVNALDLVGIFPDYESAYKAWRGKAQQTVDNAHTRYFIAHIHRLREENDENSITEQISG